MPVTRRACLHTAAGALFFSAAARTFAVEETKLKIVLLSGSAEYHSDESLAAFSKELEKNYRVQCTLITGKDSAGDPLTGIEALDTADLVIVFTRRLRPPVEQLQRFKKYCESGKPIIGIRTASHAFQDWLEFDKLILGGNYQSHYAGSPPAEVKIIEKAKSHPILAGVEPFKSPATLYKNPGVGEDGKVQLLLIGTIPDHTEPVAWCHERASGGRVFYTSLGGPGDFENPTFHRLLTNAIFWTARQDDAKMKR
jgi:type 1 glutamine amidotransferase